MELASKNNNFYYNKELKDRANELRNNMTKAECCLWKYLLKAKKMHGYQFNRQRPVLNYIVDFICKELMLVIEVDGVTHTFNKVEIKDFKKQKDLEEIGFTVLRFKDGEILRNMGDIEKTLENYISQMEKK
jgi:very-short-patch-repair endonuclease